MMKTPSLIITFILSLQCYTAYAGTLEQGHDAFDRKDYAAAYKIWKPLAEAGDADAQFNIALLYKNGLGIKKDERQALWWFVQAGKQGLADAQYNAGVMYYNGEGVYPSHKSAVEWWQLAARHDHANAQYNLGSMYAYAQGGLGVDMDKALSLWISAAEAGHEEAVNTLIKVYTHGMPKLPPNPDQAAHWKKIKQTYFNE